MNFGNLLKKAKRHLPQKDTAVQLLKFTGNEILADGTDNPQYAPPVTVKCNSIQPLEEHAYDVLGIDLQQEAYIVYIPASAMVFDGQHSPDRLDFYGKIWKVYTTKAWNEVDQWRKIIVIRDVDYAERK